MPSDSDIQNFDNDKKAAYTTIVNKLKFIENDFTQVTYVPSYPKTTGVG